MQDPAMKDEAGKLARLMNLLGVTRQHRAQYVKGEVTLSLNSKVGVPPFEADMGAPLGSSVISLLFKELWFAPGALNGGMLTFESSGCVFNSIHGCDLRFFIPSTAAICDATIDSSLGRHVWTRYFVYDFL